MSPAPVLRKARSLKNQRADQRLHHRYPIVLEVEYKVLNKRRVQWLGYGRTLNISSGGVLLEAHASLPLRSQVELSVNWPFLLEGVCPMKLLIRGRIVRSEGEAVAIKTDRHEFRLAGARPSHFRPSSEKAGA